jgi:hypothetical protein
MQKTWFLLLSSSTCIVVYFTNILFIGYSEHLGYIFPTENPPITRCFQDIVRFNSSKYRLFFSENHTLLDIFEVCNNYDECKPAIRICSENENPADELWKVFIPVGVGLLGVSFFASWILQLLGNDHVFVKFLIRIGANETNSFIGAFLYYNSQMPDKNIESELRKILQNLFRNSKRKSDAFFKYCEIISKEDITEEDQKLLKENLHIIKDKTNVGYVWKTPLMNRAVEKKQLHIV